MGRKYISKSRRPKVAETVTPAEPENKAKDDNYQVGYKQPPKHTQFQPGKSGNPAGRPKKVRNLRTDIKDLMDQMVVITEGGKTKEMTGRMVLLKSLFAKGAQGNVAAAEKLLKLDGRYEGGDEDSLGLSNDDLSILDLYVARKGNA